MLFRKLYDYFMARRKMKQLFEVGHMPLIKEMMYREKRKMTLPEWLQSCVRRSVRKESTDERSVKIYAILAGVSEEEMKRQMIKDGF